MVYLGFVRAPANATGKMFQPLKSQVNFPALEDEIGRFWEERKIYEKSLARRAGAPPFIFYEGPPTANGMPHPGHCLTRAIKDLFPRYRTMRGFHCERKAGWDTHGLPVEVEVCKELGIHSKEEIEAYGVEKFIHKCQESVWRYMKEWERLTRRIGFWLRLDEAYVTYHQSYVESVWWSLKNLYERGLLYEGHKIVWWWAQGGTALSSGEVSQGYREVADPSVFVRFPIVNEHDQETGESLLVWTTTPWTLPSNQFAAVHAEIEYALVNDPEGSPPGKVYMASSLVDSISAKIGRPLTVEKTMPGTQLVGLFYRPPFDYFYRQDGRAVGKLKAGGTQRVAWRVVTADFVTTKSGSGIVHEAPAFGEVDFDLLLAEQARFSENGPRLICPVLPNGTFTSDVSDYQGRWVKETDKEIARDLKRRGLLFHQEQYLHEYPFCWRADKDPLIQFPRKSWFIRTSQFKDAMLSNNRRINWLPDHIRDGRFGNFLESNVDWALSRERYWGTPLPIWRCAENGYTQAIASYAELLEKPGIAGVEVWEQAKRDNPNLCDDLRVHKPYIDAITYDCPTAPQYRMRRVNEVIDCWYDSGAMPFAQWGYPHQGEEQFNHAFPADFISEALDQTRGWFYSQLAISTLLFSREQDAHKSGAGQIPSREYPHPFRNCIVLGLMLGEDGQKMSKQKRNYREPNEIFDKYGADAMRWFFFANQPPWTTIQYKEQAIKDSIPEFLLKIWNVYSFFVIYALADHFDPAERLPAKLDQLTSDELAQGQGYRPVQHRRELDRWIVAKLHQTVEVCRTAMDAYDNSSAARAITDFVEALANWYVRRSRKRFWSGDLSDDKFDAHWTLYECLLTTTKLVAPFVPFLSEELWKNLAVAGSGGRVLESVHLCDYPGAARELVDAQLLSRMDHLREIVSLGHAARVSAKIKVRQPLQKLEIVLADRGEIDWLKEHDELIREELNVKEIEFPARAEQYIEYNVLPDLKKLGPKLGKQLPEVRAALGQIDAGQLMRTLEQSGTAKIPVGSGHVELTRDELQVRLKAKEGWTAAQGTAAVVVLSTTLTPELVREGVAREFVHVVQSQRKETGCEYTDRIRISVATPSEVLREAIVKFKSWIQDETLAVEIALVPNLESPGESIKIGEFEFQLAVRKV